MTVTYGQPSVKKICKLEDADGVLGASSPLRKSVEFCGWFVESREREEMPLRTKEEMSSRVLKVGR